MSAASFVSLGVLIVVLAVSIGPLGRYMAKVYGGDKAPGDRVFLPVERLIYRLLRRRPEARAALERLRPVAAGVQPGVGAGALPVPAGPGRGCR